MSPRSVATLVVVLSLFTWTPTARASDAGTSPDAGPTRCKTSDDCSSPNPYCHPTLGTCVQCIADTNCLGVSLVCDQARGICSNCRTNADCFNPTPYCSAAFKGCVECITDANCGSPGVHCANGLCGSCGDNSCSSIERSGIFGVCKDCLIGCAKNDLQSKTGPMVASGTLSSAEGLYLTACGSSFSTPGFGASFKWTAPSDGGFSFSAMDAYVAVLQGDCSGPPLSCYDVISYVNATKGQEYAVIVTKPTAGSYTLSIAEGAPACDVTRCPTGPVGELPCCTSTNGCGYMGQDGCSSFPTGVPPGATDSCMSAATMNPGPYCPASAKCSCDKCAQQHIGCLTGPTGCLQILGCVERFKCGASCYSKDTCAAVIDMNGGMEGPAYAQASALAGCDQIAGCSSLCMNQPDAATGGAPGAGGVGSAGRFAAGGASKTPPPGNDASGGSTSVGEDAGTGAHHGSTTTSGGCGCAVPRDVEPPTSALSALAAAGLAAFARRRRRRVQG